MKSQLSPTHREILLSLPKIGGLSTAHCCFSSELAEEGVP